MSFFRTCSYIGFAFGFTTTDIRRLKQLYLKKESTVPEAPLFAGRGGNHPTTTALQISFKKAIEKAELNPKYSIHSARHTYGTHLYHATKNLRYVQKQLGHSNITMTSIYADILPSENGKLANMIRKVG